MHAIAWEQGMLVISHFLQLQYDTAKYTVRLYKSFFTSNFVYPTQQGSHLLHAIFSLFNLFITLGHISDSTFIIFSLFS